MPRLPRLAPIGIPQHVIQRGNNRQPCFCASEDYGAYVNFLKVAAIKYHVDIHAWCFMTNHVHLLVTPKVESAVSLMMQSLGRQYVQFFNHKYKRSGTLWEGRSKSCLIDSDTYLLICYRYIELNPVRAKMVEQPEGYRWSSHPINTGLKKSDLITYHENYLRLGATHCERIQNYKSLFSEPINHVKIDNLRAATNRGLVVGSDYFKDEIEKMMGQSVRPKPVGNIRGHVYCMIKRLSDNLVMINV